MPRFAELGVAANLQMLWACHDEQMIELRSRSWGRSGALAVPLRDLHRAGATLVAGSDWPVSTPDPLAAIHTAVTRTSYGEPAPAGTDPFLPEQALPLEIAFAAYTSGSARANHRMTQECSSQLPSPTSWCSTGTRSRAPRTRSVRGE